MCWFCACAIESQACRQLQHCKFTQIDYPVFWFKFFKNTSELCFFFLKAATFLLRFMCVFEFANFTNVDSFLSAPHLGQRGEREIALYPTVFVRVLFKHIKGVRRTAVLWVLSVQIRQKVSWQLNYKGFFRSFTYLQSCLYIIASPTVPQLERGGRGRRQIVACYSISNKP